MRRPLLAAFLLSVLGCSSSLDEPAPPVGDFLEDGVYDDLPREFEGQTYAPSFSLVEKLTPVRNQAWRNTCTTFASIALMEYLYKTEYGWEAPDFSEQYLQWLLKGQGFDPWPNAETSNAWYAMTAIQRHGVPEESFWPFEPQNPSGPPCEGDDRPGVPCYTGHVPAGDPELWSMPAGEPRWVHPDDIKGHLIAGNAPVIGDVKWAWQSWSHVDSPLPVSGDYKSMGVVPYPSAADIEAMSSGGHTFLIVGWDDVTEVPILDADGNFTGEMDRGFYIFKNSLGTELFGPENPHGAGFGLISQRYMSEYGRGMTLDRARR